MDNSLLLEILKGTSFTNEELNIISKTLKKVTYKKGDLILINGDKVLYTHYVYSGCLRTYFIDKFGKEHTLQFAIKDWWISDYTALFARERSILNIECIQDAIIYKLSRKEMEQLYIDIPSFETFFRKKLEKRFAAFQRRTLGNLAETAKERYLSFLKTYPSIEKNINNYHIASYLGITPESLSRIRKEIAGQ